MSVNILAHICCFILCVMLTCILQTLKIFKNPHSKLSKCWYYIVRAFSNFSRSPDLQKIAWFKRCSYLSYIFESISVINKGPERPHSSKNESPKKLKNAICPHAICPNAICMFNYSKPANLGSRMDCNTFLNMVGSLKMLTKYGPLDLLFSTEIL